MSRGVLRVFPACSALCAVLSAFPAAAGEVLPPEVLTKAEARLPVVAPPPEQDHVLLEVTVGADGRAWDITVIESAGPAWDAAAREALQRWTFRPARHEGAPVSSRIRISFAMPSWLAAADAGAAAGGGASPASEDAAPAGLPDGGLPATPAKGAGAPAAAAGGPAVPSHDGAAPADGRGGAPADEPRAADAGHPLHEMSTTVTARTVPKSRGAADVQFEVVRLRAVPRTTGGDFLELAPGVLLTNEGGEGHAERIFLRGFDAREGQDLEVSVGGVPVNDSGNLHGNGFADLNFLVPEAVLALRVIEGPFDPRQGNYAVAGSAEYELGLVQRGLTVRGTYGSFDTQRLTLLFGPPREEAQTFAAAQLSRTAGFGQNRAAQSARALGQWDLRLGDATSLRLLGTFAAARFQSAGALRADDVVAGRVGFFDTHDARQGGDSLRGSLSAELHLHREGFTQHHQLFAVLRSARLLENFTGYVHDAQRPWQAPHPQRGDLLDRDTQAATVGARGYGRYRAPWRGHAQELELGYFARLDFTQGQQQRLLGPDGNVPYRKELDLSAKLSDIGLYADANFAPLRWLALRGGLRADLLTYSVQDECAVQEVRRPSTAGPPGDASCLSQRDFGLYREPTERVSATGAAVMPRGTVLVGPFHGVTLAAAAGAGVRSIDPQFVNQNRETPFASIFAWEAGATSQHAPRDGAVEVTGRAAVFGTRVDRDLVFSEQAGRNVLGGSTSRLGVLAQGRARGDFFDAAAHATLVQSRFDDTGLLVPYVPDLVLRADGAAFHALPWRLDGSPVTGTLGLGLTYVGRRALPLGQRSDVIFTVDASAELAWRFLSLGLAATNLLDARYRQQELNYAADFRATPPYPTLVPSRLFVAGAPRQVLVTLAVNVGGAR